MVTVVLVGGLAAWFGKRSVDRVGLNLRHFTASEFGAYWPLMSVDLLKKLDAFRAELGYPVAISPAPGAIGRPTMLPDGSMAESESSAEKSQHNYLIHGEVRAVDVMPVPPGGASEIERRRWVAVAKKVGFSGIGLYPHWRPRPGLHLDVRIDRTAANPAQWARLKLADGTTKDVSIDQGYTA